MTAPAARDHSALERRWLEIALIFVVFFVAGGAPVPHVNETHYLAKAKHYWQPEWCAGDLFLESGKAHLTFYWTVGWLTKWFPLTTVAWIGRVAAWLALAIAWQRLSRCVLALPLGGVVSAMLLVTLIDWTNFAGEWVVGGVEGKCFAYALVFWGLAALCQQRWNHVWPLLGLASAFHALVGGWSVVAAIMVWMSQPRDERMTFTAMLPSLLLGGVLALPGVIPALLLTRSIPPEIVDEGNQIYVFDRLSHHLAPLSKPPAELGRKALRFGMLLIGFAWLIFFCTRQPQTTQAESPSSRSLELLMRFALASLVISVVGLSWELATWNQPALAAKFLKYYVFRLADIALPLATCLMVGWLAHALLKRESKWGALLLLLATTLPALHLLDLSLARRENRRPPADRRIKHFESYREACDWASRETPHDAVFLVPRHAHSFKWYAGRSDLVTWKDVPQNAKDLVTWRDRFFDAHWHYNQEGNRVPYRSLADQGTKRIRELAEKYELDYVLTKEYPPLDLPVVYSNRDYTIYSTTTQLIDH